MPKYVDTLKKLGLSSAEATIFEDLLANGSSPAGQISKRSKLSRGSVYNALDNLKSRNIVVVKKLGKVEQYSLVEPGNLEIIVDEDLARAVDAKESWKRIMNSVYSDYNLTYGKPVVTSYEGKSAIKEIYEDALESTHDKKIVVFRSHLDDEVLGVDFFTEYIERRASRGIETKIIVPFPIIKDSLDVDKKMLKERKYWPGFKIPAEIAVYADKVSIISFQDRIIGTIIDNKAIAESMRVIFDKVWESLN